MAYYLEKFIRKNDAIFIVGSALIDGTIQSYDGQSFGQKSKMSLVLLTQSDGNHVVEEMVKRGLTDFFHTVLLDNLSSEETEHGEYGVKIIKAKYLTEDEYYQEVDKLPEYSRNDMGLSVGNLKRILRRFNNSDMLEVWREIYETENYEYLMGDQTERFDTCYEANGSLTFKISTSVDDLERTFKSVKVSDIFKKAGIFHRLYKPSVLNVYGETNYYENECENIKKALKDLYSLTKPNEPIFGLLHSDDIDVISMKIRKLLNEGESNKIQNSLEKISKIISRAYERNTDIKKSNYYLKFKTLKEDINSHTPFFITYDDRYMVFGANDNLIKFMELKTGKIIKEFEGHKKGQKIEVVTLSPDGKYFASCASNYKNYYSLRDTIMIRNYETEDLITEIHDPSSHSTDYKNYITIPDGNKYLISGVNTISIWDIITGDMIHQIEKPHKDELHSLKCSPDGKYLISASSDSTIKTWEIETGELIHTFKEHKCGITNASFNPDGKYVISNSWDKTIKVWEFLSGDVLKTLGADYFESFPYSSMISPDGKQIIAIISFGVIDKPSMVKIWDFNTSKLLQTLFWKNGDGWGYVNNVKISPQGNYLISCSYDHNASQGMINICVSRDHYSKLID